MPSDRWDLAVAVVTNAAGQSILYAMAGHNSSGSLSQVQAYNVATNTWTWKAPMPAPLYFTNGAGVISGKIYISGGEVNPTHFSQALYMYDPAKNIWTRKRDMPTGGIGGVTGVINGKLYVLTGCIDMPCLFYRYNPVTDQWGTLPIPTTQHRFGMGGVIGGKLYVTGGHLGYDDPSTLEVYDPGTNQWTTKARMPLPRGHAGAAVLGGQLYVIGGGQENLDGTITSVRTTSIYNPATNVWTTKAPLPSARDNIAASKVFLDGQPRIALVGGSRPGNNLQYVP
jgi:N-acetylneuraminic acid mutarotase